MRTAFFAAFAAMLTLDAAAQDNALKSQYPIAADVSGYQVTLGGKVGAWLTSCRYMTPPLPGPYIESVDWGDGATSVAEDYDVVSCGNIARHIYDEPGDYRITVRRTEYRGLYDEVSITEEIKMTATVEPEIAADVAEDEIVQMGGQIGTKLASCEYPREGRGYWSVLVDWGDGHGASACSETLSHRYEEPGAYTITVSSTGPGPDDGPVNSQTSIDVVIP